MKHASHHNFESCLVITNPAGTSRHRSNTFIKQLKAIFPSDKFEVIEIETKDYNNPKALVKKIVGCLSKDSLVCIGGGDGTNSFAVNLLLQNSELKKHVSKITLLPLWGGNANDLAHMANGSGRRADIAKILDKGRRVEAFPLEVTVTHRKSVNTHLAVCYTSFGTSAHAIQRMSKPSYRSKKLYRLGVTRLGIEMASVAKALLRAKPFQGQLQGRKRKMYDLILINGSRMAKVTRGPAKLTEPAFYELRIHRKHPVILMYAGLVIGNRSFIKRRNTSVDIEVHDGTWAQVDGEVLWIPPKSTVKVQPFKDSFTLLSTKLK